MVELTLERDPAGRECIVHPNMPGPASACTACAADDLTEPDLLPRAAPRLFRIVVADGSNCEASTRDAAGAARLAQALGHRVLRVLPIEAATTYDLGAGQPA